MTDTVELNQFQADPHRSTHFDKPRVGVVVPHFNYSGHLEEALISVQQQTHENFRCVVVDDHSSDAHFEAAIAIVASMQDDRFTLVRNPENIGQVRSMYRGLEEFDAAFVSFLDPDDRLVPEFIARMLAAHLNPLILCPVVSCDQYLLKSDDGIITSTQRSSGLHLLMQDTFDQERDTFDKYAFHRFVPAKAGGWHWGTTSSLMFRTDAVMRFKPCKPLKYKGEGDTYFAQGAHMLGGTLMLRQPLIYRGMHENNTFLNENVFSMFQTQARANAEMLSDVVRLDVIESLFANGGNNWCDPKDLQETIKGNFNRHWLPRLLARVPAIAYTL